MSTAEPNIPYASLSPDCVIQAVESLGYISDARIFPLNSYENRVYQVGIDEAEPLIAKFYRPERWDDQQIIEEHQFSLALAELEIPVVPPLFNKAGETLFYFDTFRFALYPRRGGYAPELDNDDNLFILGRYLGRIHALGKTQNFQHRPTLDVDSFAAANSEFLLENQFIPAELRPAYSSLCDHLLEKLYRLFKQYPFTAIRMHGDCHPGNILWRNDIPNFVDLDDARNGPAMQDLWMLLSGSRERQQQQLVNLLEGYEEFCEFNSAELNLVEGLRTLRLMYYAAWLARRWHDPAFPLNFPWFNTEKYWAEHILELREQLAALDEPPLESF